MPRKGQFYSGSINRSGSSIVVLTATVVINFIDVFCHLIKILLLFSLSLFTNGKII
jgi:hypothetical protein